MKLKFYIRGLGIGILVTTLILTISTTVQGNKKSSEEETTKSSSVITYTKADTATIESLTSTVETQVETDSIEKQTVKETIQETIKETVQETTQKSTEITTKVTDGQKVTVVLSNINYSGKASQLIADAGIVDDAAALNKYLENNGYSTKILDGTYTFTKGQDYESIAKTITKK